MVQVHWSSSYDFDVIAPDMRGYGDLEKPDLRDLSKYHLNVVTDDHAKLLQHLGIKQAYMVGHDYSALIMHKFVRRYRDMTIKGLTIDPIVPGFEERYLSVGHFPEFLVLAVSPARHGSGRRELEPGGDAGVF